MDEGLDHHGVSKLAVFLLLEIHVLGLAKGKMLKEGEQEGRGSARSNHAAALVAVRPSDCVVREGGQESISSVSTGKPLVMSATLL